MKANSGSAAMLVALCGLAISGCAGAGAPSPEMKDSMGWVHAHKGEGTRRVLVGTEAQLMDEATGLLDLSYTVTREPHALFASLKDTSISFSYAFYFYPAQASDRTEVETLVASNWLQDEGRKIRESAPATFFPLANLSSRLLEAGYDPGVAEGDSVMLPLSTAAFYGSGTIAKKLIAKGARLDAAIDDLKKIASRNLEYRKHAENNRTYERANAGVAMLEGLRSGANDTDAKGATPPSDPATSKPASGKGDIADRLRKLNDLKKQGLVTEQEYQRKKQELLDQL